MPRTTINVLVKSLLVGLIIATGSASAYELHGTFSDHMVLQRDQSIRIYGTGEAGETISVQLGHHHTSTELKAAGKWQVTFPAHKLPSKQKNELRYNRHHGLG